MRKWSNSALDSFILSIAYFWTSGAFETLLIDALQMTVYPYTYLLTKFNLISSSLKQQHACDKQRMRWEKNKQLWKCGKKNFMIWGIFWVPHEADKNSMNLWSAYSDTLWKTSNYNKQMNRSRRKDMKWVLNDIQPIGCIYRPDQSSDGSVQLRRIGMKKKVESQITSKISECMRYDQTKKIRVKDITPRFWAEELSSLVHDSISPVSRNSS